MKALSDQNLIQNLYECMPAINPAVANMETFEFGYLLEPLTPADGWASVKVEAKVDIEQRVNDSAFYTSIQLRPKVDSKPVMDAQVLALTQTLLVGLAAGVYEPEWIDKHFTFDIRGAFFLHRTQYYSPAITARLSGKPYRQFEPLQKQFEGLQAVGYKDFMQANTAVDACFIDLTLKLVERLGAPLIIAIAGQTAAGKTEITERLTAEFEAADKKVTTLEIDHFLLDRDYREANGIDSLGLEALHQGLFKACLQEIRQGKPTSMPRYDFISATSSHDLNGNLKDGCQMQTIQPADIIFMEGNFPFLDPDIAALIGIKAMYLTEDDVRLKRKWKRDMDYRKKYELYYFLNRYFREQFIMAEKVYRPQMALCDLIVDTTQASLWLLPELQTMLETQL